MRLFRRIWTVLALSPSLLLAVINLRLYAAPTERYTPAHDDPEYRKDVRLTVGAESHHHPGHGH